MPAVLKHKSEQVRTYTRRPRLSRSVRYYKARQPGVQGIDGDEGSERPLGTVRSALSPQSVDTQGLAGWFPSAAVRK